LHVEFFNPGAAIALLLLLAAFAAVLRPTRVVRLLSPRATEPQVARRALVLRVLGSLWIAVNAWNLTIGLLSLFRPGP
jgi:hypothetical protein